MMKKIITITLAAAMTIAMTMTAMAGTWQIDGKNADGTDRWWYSNGDGTYPRYEWMWIADSTGVQKCYHFDEYGYMDRKVNVDNCYVNSDGQWSINGVVQTR